MQNLVRQALYFNYDRYKEMGHHAWKNEERILRLHVSKLAPSTAQQGNGIFGAF